MFHSPIPAGPHVEQNVYAILGDRARHKSLGHLAAEATIGSVGCAALAITHLTWWALYLPLGVIASYGFWGLLDRAARALQASRLETRIARGVVISADWLLVALGTAGVIAFFLALTRVAFQGWIH
ncbi:MAG TPA: hypothetical protein VGT98_03355 [Candidatus Elarobacter sp.]|nr:hypothetical protein [Candidatus Elarobacter sp.]